MQLVITSLLEMRRYLGQVSHVLSIVDPDDTGIIPRKGVPADRHLVLACDDVESVGEALARERAMPGSRCVAPTTSMVKRALKFADELSDADILLIHCNYGQSRSPALALAILAQAEPHVAEGELFQRVLQLRPQAVPNALIVEHADKLLKRRGRLSKAILAR